MWTLPILCWFLVALLLARRGSEWRASLILAAIMWGCLVTIFTEFLSYLHLLTASGFGVCWTGVTAVVILLHFKLKKPWQGWGDHSFSTVEKGLAGGIALICFVTFLTAIMFPPNNWDSMTYHMSRVMHWLQNRSVDHYPTHILRQIEMNPWAEFALAHFQSLSGGDRFANLVQWFSMGGSLLGASLIAAQLGGNRHAQLFSAVVVATIPMGILQSSSTQNDYVVSFWLICLAWTGLHFMREQGVKWAILTGASLGLAVLSKGTAYLYAFPFVIWLAVTILRVTEPRRAVTLTACIVIPFMLLNVNHYHRNVKAFSNPLSLRGDRSLTNENISAGTLISNLLRNTALQLSSPFNGLDKFIEKGVVKLHERLTLDPNDPKTTWHGWNFSVVSRNRIRHEDYSGNFLHAVLAITMALVLLRGKSFRKVDASVLCYVSAVATGFLLFCLVLKWQPWGNRLLLPLLVLGAAATGVFAEKHWKPGLQTLVAFVLLTAALPWAFSNAIRPLVQISDKRGEMLPLLTFDRNRLYFVNRSDLYEEYMQIAGEIRQNNATNIGLILGRSAWEYPLWVLIKQANPSTVRIEHVEVDNVSSSIPLAHFRPDYYVRIKK